MNVDLAHTVPPGPDETRLRRLRRLHWAAVAVLSILIVLGSLLLARHISTSADDYQRADAVENRLVQLRTEMQDLLATYWRGRAISGGPSIPPELTVRYLTATVGLTAILNERRNEPREGPLTDRVQRSMSALTPFVTSNQRFTVGSADELEFRSLTEKQIEELDQAVGAWFTQIETSLAEQLERDRNILIRTMAVIGLLVAALVSVAFALWFAIDRARRAALARVAAERDATRVVMASVDDGLAVLDSTGTVTDANERLSELIGRDREEIVGHPPPWADHVAGFGETDLALDGLPDDRALSLAASPLAHGHGSLHVVRDITERRRRDAETRNAAAEQEALRRVATFVAADSPPARVFELVAREIAIMLGADVGVVTRFDPLAERIVNVGTWVQSGSVIAEAPTRVPLDGGSPVAVVFRTGAPVRVEDITTTDPTTADVFAGHGIHAGVAAPVQVGSVRWGAVAAFTSDGHSLAAGAEERLARFAELVELTVANADARARLANQAATDPLTGLANHRTFHERLEEEINKARRTNDELSLVILDLDRFKEVNDAFGHQVGDDVLAEAAQRLAGEARSGELVARIGGEEFAWIMPGTDGINAWRAAERARRSVAATPFPGGVGTVTASAGVSDLTQADGAIEMMRYADGALYWAKASGRNVTLRYSPHVVRELSESERAERLARSQAVTALRALARAVDAKDPSTARHAERVAAISLRIAAELGWTPERLEQLEEAALLHDVGKIGVPDALLFKADRLAPREMREVEAHAVLGAEIVSDVLSSEQVRWVRGHHERWDGNGYPDGLAGEDISDGATIIAVADSWDAMTSVRLYGTPKTFPEALAEARRCAEKQFSPAVVAVLEELGRVGRLTLTDIRYPGEPQPDSAEVGTSVSAPPVPPLA